VIIIAGGYDKGLAFDELGERIAQKAKAAILIGQTARKIANAIAKRLATENTEKRIKVEIVDSLAAAVGLARELATNSDVVLLSPACASYDMFDNFEHRGREFCRLVRETSG
jgi:UDP-N-acetylmuramoylalanine--D-glutamate ligase